MPLPHLIQAHPLLLLVACAAGVLLALVYLVGEYLVVPYLRLRRAVRRGPDEAARLLNREGRRLSRLRDAVAIAEEHDDPDVPALREEAELRAVSLLWLKRRGR